MWEVSNMQKTEQKTEQQAGLGMSFRSATLRGRGTNHGLQKNAGSVRMAVTLSVSV